MRLDLAMGLKNTILKAEAAITKVGILAITKINNFCESRDAENENNPRMRETLCQKYALEDFTSRINNLQLN